MLLRMNANAVFDRQEALLKFSCVFGRAQRMKIYSSYKKNKLLIWKIFNENDQLINVVVFASDIYQCLQFEYEETFSLLLWVLDGK